MITLEPPRRLPGEADSWAEVGLSQAGLSQFLKRARRKAGLPGEVDVLLGSDATLRRLNREFRGKDKSTDVLSFPVPTGMPGNRSGDLAISLPIAARQAAEFGHSVFDEVCILILHGLLHLAGMDHETDAGEMAGREAELRADLALPGSLIARVYPPATPPARRRKAATR